jgi:regulator of protease activity HflC (stomatin/prohibitin superfamily)
MDDSSTGSLKVFGRRRPSLWSFVILAIFILPQAVRILREYERGVVFRLGKLQGAKGPGLIFLIPHHVDKMVKMDLRVVTIDVSKQEIMTKDNVPATVDAVVYFRVVSPNDAVVKVENFWKATSLIAQTTLRSVLGQASLDDLLSQRDVINQKAYRRSSTARPSRGASRSRRWKSRTCRCPTA